MFKRFLWIGPNKYLLALYLLTVLVLVLYSYTQVDLNLTLSRASVIQSVQKGFQYVGFYQRPISAGVYVGIVGALFGLYLWTLALAGKGQVTMRHIKRLVMFCSVGLVFSYPAALSYDFFNYLFTAKTVLVYQQNPYTVTPLAFAPIDPWVNFMRWTHLPSAYTPLWIGMTLVPFILGAGYFLPVLFATKILVMIFFILACNTLANLLDRLYPKDAVFRFAVFALNPLVLVETLVSAHNDIVMVSFLLFALWSIHQKDQLSAWWYLALSVGAKLVTIVLIPVVFFKKNTTWMLWFMVVALSVVVARRGMLPWYWVWIVPLISLAAQNRPIVAVSTFFSMGLLLSYVPYIYTGAYTTQVVYMQSVISYIFLGIGALWAGYMLVSATRRRT